VHGHHDIYRPSSDRIILVDAPSQQERVDVNAAELLQWPLGGVDCVELWGLRGRCSRAARL